MTRFVLIRGMAEEPLSCGLYGSEHAALSNYNAERSRGIAHDDEWVVSMAELQRRFDAAQLADGAVPS